MFPCVSNSCVLLSPVFSFKFNVSPMQVANMQRNRFSTHLSWSFGFLCVCRYSSLGLQDMRAGPGAQLSHLVLRRFRKTSGQDSDYEKCPEKVSIIAWCGVYSIIAWCGVYTTSLSYNLCVFSFAFL